MVSWGVALDATSEGPEVCSNISDTILSKYCLTFFLVLTRSATHTPFFDKSMVLTALGQNEYTAALYIVWTMDLGAGED